VSASRSQSESPLSAAVVLFPSAPRAGATNVHVQLAVVGVQITWQEPPAKSRSLQHLPQRLVAPDRCRRRAVEPIIPPARDEQLHRFRRGRGGQRESKRSGSIQLLVSPVNNLSVLSVLGQAPVLTWTGNDPTAAGFNVYRNGIQQNSALLTGDQLRRQPADVRCRDLWCDCGQRHWAGKPATRRQGLSGRLWTSGQRSGRHVSTRCWSITSINIGSQFPT